MSLTQLNPNIVIDDWSFTVMTQEVAGLDRNQLGVQAFGISRVDGLSKVGDGVQLVTNRV